MIDEAQKAWEEAEALKKVYCPYGSVFCHSFSTIL